MRARDHNGNSLESLFIPINQPQISQSKRKLSGVNNISSYYHQNPTELRVFKVRSGCLGGSVS